MKKLLLFAAFLFGFTSIKAQTVTNLNNAGPGSLRNVVLNSSSGDTISFDTALLNNGSDTLFLDYAIPIVHSLTIKGLFVGSDTLYIDGQDSTQLFFADLRSMTPSEELTFQDLVLTNGKQFSSNLNIRNTNGGAVSVLGLGKVAFKNVRFDSNRTTGEAEGGAVYVYDVDSVIFDHCKFYSNVTDSVGMIDLGGFGGAISARLSHVKVLNSVFLNNYAPHLGGAFFSDQSSVEVYDCRFDRNTAGPKISNVLPNGGGLYFRNGDSLIVKRTMFIENWVDGSGAGLYATAANPTIENCYFQSNLNPGLGGGGAMKLVSCVSTINKSAFVSNLSADGGNAIFTTWGEITISASTFDNNWLPGNWPSIGSCIKGSATTRIEYSTLYHTNPQQGILDLNDTTVLSNSILVGYPQVGIVSPTGVTSSEGYNIYSTAPTFRASTDIINTDTTSLDLGALALYGGLTPTRLPSLSSPAYNAGNPNDFAPAQNGPVFGRREIGAAERQVIRYDSTLVCGTYNWWGNTYNQPGNYSDTVFNANSIDSIGVLILYGQDTAIRNQNGTLIAEEQSAGTTYQWFDCDDATTVSGATDSTFLPSANGSYAVIVSNGNCSDTSACIQYDEVDIDEFTAKRLLSFYPNPTSGSITIDDSSRLPSELQVVDLTGRIVVTQEVQSRVVELPYFSSGVYLLKWVFESGEVQVDRVVVE